MRALQLEKPLAWRAIDIPEPAALALGCLVMRLTRKNLPARPATPPKL